MAGYSKYPTNLDNETSIPTAVDNVTPVEAASVNRLRDAVLAVEAELGTDPSGTFGTVKARLDNLYSLIYSAQSEIDIITAELGSNVTGSFSTVADRLSNLETLLTALQAQVDALETALATAAEIVTPIVSGIQINDSTTYSAIGGCVLNPTDLGYPAVTFTIEVLIQTTDTNYRTDFELYNITEGTTVSHPSIFTVSESVDFVSVNLTVGGADLPADQDNVLEARIKIASGAAPADRAICKYAAIRSKP